MAALHNRECYIYLCDIIVHRVKGREVPSLLGILNVFIILRYTKRWECCSAIEEATWVAKLFNRTKKISSCHDSTARCQLYQHVNFLHPPPEKKPCGYPCTSVLQLYILFSYHHLCYVLPCIIKLLLTYCSAINWWPRKDLIRKSCSDLPNERTWLPSLDQYILCSVFLFFYHHSLFLAPSCPSSIVFS